MTVLGKLFTGKLNIVCLYMTSYIFKAKYLDGEFGIGRLIIMDFPYKF